MCVRHIKESGKLRRWSRWQIVPDDGLRGTPSPMEHGGLRSRLRSHHHHQQNNTSETQHGYTADFTFRSMVDTYQPTRTYLCMTTGLVGPPTISLDCDPKSATAAVAVMRLDARSSAAGVVGQEGVFCVGRNDIGYTIARGANCSLTNGSHYPQRHIAAFAVPKAASGRSWCVAACGGLGELSEVRSHANCSDSGCQEAFSFHEVTMEDLSEDLGVLSLTSV